MTTNQNPISRRTILRSGGMVAATSAFLAACGGANKTVTRIGSAETAEKLSTETVTDVSLLRTAQSVELLVAAILSDSRVTNLADKDSTPVVQAFTAAHRTAAASIAPLVTARGGQSVDAANDKLMVAFGEPALALIAEGKVADDVLTLALALETLTAATYQYFVQLTNEPALRAEMVRLGAPSSSRAAAVAQIINPGTGGFAPSLNDKGEPNVATLPSAFGSLSSITVSLGAPNEVGTRPTVVMDTPSLNSILY